MASSETRVARSRPGMTRYTLEHLGTPKKPSFPAIFASAFPFPGLLFAIL